ANARAAVFLAYLAAIPTGARMNLGHLVGFSAEAAPVRLTTEFVADRAAKKTVPLFTVSPVVNSRGHYTEGTVTRAFRSFVGMRRAEILEAADRLEEAFSSAIPRLSELGKKGALASADGNSLFGEYARIIAGELGYDCPLVTMLVSNPYRYALRAGYKRDGAKSAWARFVKAFSVAAGRDSPLPEAARFIVQGVRTLADVAGEDARLSGTDASLVAMELFNNDVPRARGVGYAATSLMGASKWLDLVFGYSSSKPATIMTAEVDPERTSRAESSIAVSMTGIEPMVQVFMDRRDGRGFADVVKEYGSMDVPESDCRAYMRWPDSARTPIIAKSISKTATAVETLEGCRHSFELEVDGKMPVPEGYVRSNVVYVPVFSGDHSSSIIIAVPYAKEMFAKLSKGRTVRETYDSVAEEVGRMIGLDLFADDAKRSALTSGEAPGVSLWDFRYDRDGNILYKDGKPVRGHFYSGVFWSSDPAAKEDAMLGTVHTVGFGARRLKETATDPKSGIAKFHVESTDVDPAFGVVPQFFKGLSTLSDGADERGRFSWCHPLSFIDRAAWAAIAGEEDVSTCQVGDWDSLKVSQLVSKALFAKGADGSNQKILDYVFSRIRLAVDGGIDGVTVGSTVSSEELDAIVGEIEVVNLAPTGKRGKMKLSDLVAGARLTEVDRTPEYPVKQEDAGGSAQIDKFAARYGTTYGAKKKQGDGPGARAFLFTYVADGCQAFTAANVSHEAHLDKEAKGPRNYGVDAKTAARLLRERNADIVSGRAEALSATGSADGAEGTMDARVFRNADGVCDAVDFLMSSYGAVAAVLACDAQSIVNETWYDEEAYYAHQRGESLDSDSYSARMRETFSVRAKRAARLPFPSINAPLVSGMTWLRDDGSVASHSVSGMYRDLTQGSRCIGAEDVGFFRAYRRPALQFVNSADRSFRYGMYIDFDRMSADPMYREILGRYEELRRDAARRLDDEN
ncbi:MAG: hypothetical protein HUJ63_04300, partial [Enterococcus sp.]|nr:hypothetical protein [Enterococcus sp.]